MSAENKSFLRVFLNVHFVTSFIHDVFVAILYAVARAWLWFKKKKKKKMHKIDNKRLKLLKMYYEILKLKYELFYYT